MTIEAARTRLIEVREDMEYLENEIDRSIYNYEYRKQLEVRLAEVTKEKIKLEKFIAGYAG